MTQDEFREWFREHTACFVGLSAWLEKSAQGDNAPTQREILGQWFRVLRDVELVAAKRASQAMHAGEIEEPKGFDRHPAAIRKATGVGRNTSERSWERERYDANGDRMYFCLACLDVGWVFCWHPVSMIAAVEGTLGKPFTVCLSAVLCTCAAGQSKGHRSELPRFNPKQWLPLAGHISDEAEQQRLIDWMASREPVRPANYETAFD